MACAYQTFKCLLNSWQWVGVLPYVGVKVVKVYAET